MDGVTREITLTIEQWEFLKKALDYYETGINEFVGFREMHEVREKTILPIYNQMPDEVF